MPFSFPSCWIRIPPIRQQSVLGVHYQLSLSLHLHPLSFPLLPAVPTADAAATRINNERPGEKHEQGVDVRVGRPFSRREQCSHQLLKASFYSQNEILTVSSEVTSSSFSFLPFFLFPSGWKAVTEHRQHERSSTRGSQSSSTRKSRSASARSTQLSPSVESIRRLRPASRRRS